MLSVTDDLTIAYGCEDNRDAIAVITSRNSKRVCLLFTAPLKRHIGWLKRWMSTNWIPHTAMQQHWIKVDFDLIYYFYVEQILGEDIRD